MILVDTSVWVDHLRTGSARLAGLLKRGAALGHPSVLGELALGSIGKRAEILRLLGNLPQATSATDSEVLALIERERLWGLGIGYVDAQLLAATRLSRATLWTLDRRLEAAASQLGMTAAVA
jgi:predicted nucleic acid-binding protein